MHQPQVKLTLPTAIWCCVFVANATAYGQMSTNAPWTSADTNAPSPSTLPETIVTATRTEESTFVLPYSAAVVGSREFQRLMPRTTPEALREQPSIMLQKTGHGQGSPYLRGFTGFRTLMLVDGIRLNNSTFRDGPNQYWSTVDAFSLNRLEVVRGPSSVMYGSDAIGGTVNAISKGLPAYGEGLDWDAAAYYRYSLAEASHIGRPEASVQYDRTGVLVGGSIKEFGELQGGSEVGTQRKTDYSEWDVDAKAEYSLTPNSRLVYAHQSVRLDDAWRTHSTIYGVEWSGTTRGDDLKRAFDQARDLDYLQYHATGLEGFAQEAHFSLSRHFQGEEEHRVRGDSTRQVQTVDVETLGISGQLESQTEVGRLVYGAEYYRDWVNSSYKGYNADGDLTTVRVQGPVADDATYELIGVFVQDEVPLLEDRLSLILGGRYTHAQADANRIRDPATGNTFALDEAWNNLVGSGRVAYEVDSAAHVVFFGGASQGFRAPNLSDLTRWDADWGQEIPSPGVEPEHFLSLETGARLRYGRLVAEAGYYYTFIRDMIVRVPTGEMSGTVPIVTKMNSGEGHIQGVELSGSVDLHRDWTLWGNATWMEGELETPTIVGGPVVTEPVSRLMPATFNGGLRWHHPSGKLWGEFVFTFAEKQDRLASNDKLDTQRIPPEGTPGYGICSFRLGWNPCRYASVTAGWENVTNEDYRIHGSGLNEPGRNFVLAAQVRF